MMTSSRLLKHFAAGWFSSDKDKEKGSSTWLFFDSGRKLQRVINRIIKSNPENRCIHQRVDIGIDSLKIEGRTKSHYYVARTAQTYRQAIDDALAGRAFQPELIGVLENLANRGYTDGFYKRHHSHEHQNYITGYSKSHQQQFCGEIRNYDPATGLAIVDVKNKFSVGDKLELILPEGNRDISVERMENMYGNTMQEASGGGYEVKIPLPEIHSVNGLLARYTS